VKNSSLHIPMDVCTAKINADIVVLTIGNGADKHPTAMIIHYLAPHQTKSKNKTHFKELVRVTKKYEDKHYYTIIAGDANAYRTAPNDDGINSNGNPNGILLEQAEEEANHTILKPKPNGMNKQWTRFSITLQRLREDEQFDPNEATSTVDHASQGQSAIQDGIVKEHTINIKQNLMSDHAGLSFVLRTGRTHEEALLNVKQVKRSQIQPDTVEDTTYKTLSKKTIKTWTDSTRIQLKRTQK
jgi:hypothetical protein